MNKIIILDRDGVINEDSSGYIRSVADWHPIPGSLEAIAALNKAGWRVFVITNQSGIGRGYYDLDAMHAIHDKMHEELAKHGGKIEEIFFCPHSPEEKCSCRKPKPGLVLALKEKFSVDITKAFFVGDKLTDIEVAKTSGCKPVLVLTGYGKSTLEEHPELDVPVFDNLQATVQHILKTGELS